MRFAAAIGVIAVAWSAALYVHQRRVTPSPPRMAQSSKPTSGGLSGGLEVILKPVHEHPSWEDPLALLLAIGGIAIAVGIVSLRRPSSSAQPQG